ncbi:hypothetical protein NMG29_26395 [Streptomyces cocklensis]|uniref:hypothetical protein n=1 Tax=Actinacidiphila cocklensis TaxID=887465 RepID=UPI00203EC244|nr:hypothetical protein [Actinacidiphila cocklensis]MDD1061704.1 hypothetical protein [Actinacidiphila cocklensis]
MTLLTVEASGAPTLAVVGGDGQVWLYRPEAASGSWSSLGSPFPDPKIAGSIVTSTTRQGTNTQHTLLLYNASQMWVRQGVDSDGTWFAIPSDPKLFVSQLASVTAGAEPQQHIFASVSAGGHSELTCKVAVRENSVWTWIDPGGGPLKHGAGLSATSIRDSSGRLQACVVVETESSGTEFSMLIGSGHDWRWVDLGLPPVPGRLDAALVADKGPDPQPGDEPTVVLSIDSNIWTRSLGGDWTDRGSMPRYGIPTAAFEVDATAGRRPLWIAGVSWGDDLRTFGLDDAGVRWEDHGAPGSVATVVGAYTDTRNDEMIGRVVVVDEYGDLWDTLIEGNSIQGLVGGPSGWSYHGQPTAAVTSVAGVGVITVVGGDPQPTWAFVVGSDGHLWARTADAAGWAWVDHGAPTGTSIKTGTAPIAVDPAHGPIVHVLADDGRLWVRSRSGHEWGWSDRGTPPGRLIFTVVGAAPLVTAAERLLVAAVVVTDDGHLWISVADGDSFHWNDLGTPTPTERITAGIGVEAVTSATVDIAAVGSPGGGVWTLRWTPGGTPQWTARGRPGDALIQAVVGTMHDPANASGCLVALIGNDKWLWATATTGPGQTWSRWDRPPWDSDVPSTTLLSGKGAVFLDNLPCSVVIDDRGRVHAVTPKLS